MRRLALTLVLLTSVILIRPAHAGSASQNFDKLIRLARTSVIVPLEWDGTWTTLDSVYTCQGVFQSTSTGIDTICGGKDYTPGGGTAFTLSCSGSADATSYDMTCTGSAEIFTDCNADYNMVTHGTMSGGSYHTVSTINVTYSGTGTGCDLVPPSCTQVDIWGTRTGPAPVGYCSTATRQATWGQLKSLYR